MSKTLTEGDILPTDFNPQQDDYRVAILRMLNSLSYPKGWRVVLSMDNFTERVKLDVQVEVCPIPFRIFGMTISRFNSWESRRELSAITYQTLYLLVKAQPEFLEFETIVCGDFALGNI